MSVINKSTEITNRRKLVPSLLEVDYRFIDDQLKLLEHCGCDGVHIDVMDGQFVPNLSFGTKMIKSIRQSTNLEFDIHMMVQEPHRLTQQIVDAGADVLTVHYEACKDIIATLKQIKQVNIKAGIALKPQTPVSVLTNTILEMVDVVHLMTVEPGLEGQTFISESLSRIFDVRQKLNKVNPLCDIEVDGNISATNVSEVIRAGANIIVVGKALFSGNIKQNIVQIKSLIE